MTIDHIITALQNEAAEVFPFLTPAPGFGASNSTTWKVGSQGPLTILMANLGPVDPSPGTGEGSLVFSIANTGAALGYVSVAQSKAAIGQPRHSCYGREAFDANDPGNITGCMAHLWTIWTTKVAPRRVYQIPPKHLAKLSANPQGTRIAVFAFDAEHQTAFHLTFGDRIEVALNAPMGAKPTLWFRPLPPHPQASPVWQNGPALIPLLKNPAIFSYDGPQMPLAPQDFARQLGTLLTDPEGQEAP